MVNLSITSGEPTGLSAIVVSDTSGQSVDFEYYEGGSTAEVCDCDGNVLDECGVCGGDGAIYELSLIHI